MKVRFVGAVGGEVTGSCTYFKYERTNIEFLVDCGMFQGGYNPEDKNSKPFSFVPSQIKFVILTHAHLDHCGLIPRLYREGFRGDVFCTSATAELSKLQLKDVARYTNSSFHRSDVKLIKFRCVDAQPNFGLSRFIPIDQDLTAAFTRSSHVLGAVSVNLCWVKSDGSKANIILSGDVGGNTKDNQYGSLLAGTQTPYGNPHYLVLESTYGALRKDKELTSFEKRIQKLAQLINEYVINNHELLIVPAFSLQRTQEILFDLYYLLSRKNGELIDARTCDARICDEKFFDGNGWPDFVQKAVNQLIDILPEQEYSRWANAFESGEIEGKKRWFIKDSSSLTLAEVQAALSKQQMPYPIKVVVDASLAINMSKVFGLELCRRQIMNPDETLFRNRHMAARLGLDNEDEVDEVIGMVFPKDADKDLSIGEHQIRYAKLQELPGKRVLKREGAILITGAGMCEGGPVLEHLKEGLPREDVTILLTGFMARETLGNKLVSIARAKKEMRKMPYSSIDVDGKLIPTAQIGAKIVEFGAYYSGHADCETLLSLVFDGVPSQGKTPNNTPLTVFLNHGEDDARSNLKASILAKQETRKDSRAIRVELPPCDGGWFDLDFGDWVASAKDESDDAMFEMLLGEQKRTNELLERIMALLKLNFQNDT